MYRNGTKVGLALVLFGLFLIAFGGVAGNGQVGACDTNAKIEFAHRAIAEQQEQPDEKLVSQDQQGLIRRLIDQRMADHFKEARENLASDGKMGADGKVGIGPIAGAIIGLVLEAVKIGLEMYIIHKIGPYIIVAIVALLVVNIVISFVTAKVASRTTK